MGLVERRDQVQDHISEAVAQDDAPEVLRVQHDEPVKQADSEDEGHVGGAQEIEVEAREDRGHVEESVAFVEGLDRPLQQDPAEDEFLREARREEDHDPAREEEGRGLLRNPCGGSQDRELEQPERDPGHRDYQLEGNLLPSTDDEAEIPRTQFLHVRDRGDGHEERHADEPEPGDRVVHIRLRRREEREPRDRQGEHADERREAHRDQEVCEGRILGLQEHGEEHEREDEEDVHREPDRLERPILAGRSARDRDQDLGDNYEGEVGEKVGPPRGPGGDDFGRRRRGGHGSLQGWLPQKGFRRDRVERLAGLVEQVGHRGDLAEHVRIGESVDSEVGILEEHESETQRDDRGDRGGDNQRQGPLPDPHARPENPVDEDGDRGQTEDSERRDGLVRVGGIAKQSKHWFGEEPHGGDGRDQEADAEQDRVPLPSAAVHVLLGRFRVEGGECRTRDDVKEARDDERDVEIRRVRGSLERSEHVVDQRRREEAPRGTDDDGDIIAERESQDGPNSFDSKLRPRAVAGHGSRKEPDPEDDDAYAEGEREREEDARSSRQERDDSEREGDFEEGEDRVPPGLQLRATGRDRGAVQDRSQTERDRRRQDRGDV